MSRPLVGFLVAEAVSVTGTRVSMVALPLLVLTTTGSAAQTGLVALCEMLPLVVCKVLAGPVIDRVGARRVAVVGNLASVPVVGAIPLLHDTGHLGLPGLLLLVAVAGGLRGPADAAFYALVPRLVAGSGVATERVTGLQGTVDRLASMLGAGAAGLLVAAFGAADALLVDAASFGVAAGVLAWATAGLPEIEEADDASADDPDGYLGRLAAGWRFLRRDPVLLGITVMVGLTNLLDTAWTTVLLPVWSVESGAGAAVLGLVFATFSAAAAVGAATAAVLASRLPRRVTYLVAFAIAGAPRFVVVALDAPVPAVLAVGVLAGFAAGFINPILGAVLLERIPPHLTGRVTSISVASSWALMPFGGLLGGLLVAGAGLPAALLVTGAGYALATTLPALDPRWRAIDRRPEPADGVVDGVVEDAEVSRGGPRATARRR